MYILKRVKIFRNYRPNITLVISYVYFTINKRDCQTKKGEFLVVRKVCSCICAIMSVGSVSSIVLSNVFL